MLLAVIPCIIAALSSLSGVYCQQIEDNSHLPNELRLTSLALQYPDGVIQIQNSDLSILKGHREYYTVMTFTSTDESHACSLCSTFEGILRKVSNAWFSDYVHTNFVFFVNVDLADGTNKDVFKFLDMSTVPQVRVFPPSKSKLRFESEDPFKFLTEPYIPWSIPITSFDKQVFEFADFISKTVQKNILIRQEDQVSKFFMTFAITFGIILLIKKRGPDLITSNLSKKKIYIAIIIAGVLLFTSGYQFSTMERVPFIAKNEENKIIVISGGIHYQFGIETLIVAANYLSLAMSLVILVYLGKYEITESSMIQTEELRLGLILVDNLILYLLFSCLTSIFLRKDHDYPYYYTKLL